MQQTPLSASIEPEPWLRGTFQEIPAVPRAVLHALGLAKEDLRKWCGELTQKELHERPFGLPSVAFQLRHIARSVDRLLTYAESGELSLDQIALLKSESDDSGTSEELYGELDSALKRALGRIKEF